MQKTSQMLQKDATGKMEEGANNIGNDIMNRTDNNKRYKKNRC